MATPTAPDSARGTIGPVLDPPLETKNEARAGARSLIHRLKSAVLHSGVAMAFNGGSTFLVNVAVASLLGKAVFGEFTVVLSTLLTICSVAPLAVGVTATKYVAEFRNVDRLKVGRVLGLCAIVSTSVGLFSAAGLAGMSPWLARSILKNPALASGLAIVSAAVFFNVVNVYRSSALAGFENYISVAKAAVFAGTSYAAFCVAGAWYGGRDGALIGISASAAVQWWALRVYLRGERARWNIADRCGNVLSERGLLLRFSLPAALSGLSAMPALWIGSVFLVRQPHGYEQMALYGAAATLRVLVLFVPQLVNGVALSILNNVRGSGDRPAFLRLARMNLFATAGLVVAGAGAVAAAGPWLLGLFGPNFSDGYAVLLILIGSAVVESLTLAVCQVLQAEERMWSWALGVTIPRDLLIVILAYWLSRRFGASGLALANTLGWTMALLMTAVLAFRAIRTPRTNGTTPAAGGPVLRRAE